MIAGRYFDGRNSAPAQVTLDFSADGQLRIHGLPEPVAAPFAEVTISDRVGNITRRFEFPGGAVFETNENDAVDAALEATGRASASGLVHWLESRWQVALGSLAGVVLVTFAFLTWGVPAIANFAAAVLPPAMDRAIGSGTLDVLDRTAFEPSLLPARRQRELQERFAEMAASLDDGHEYQLELREGRAVGPNAFALPSGIIIMTDELVELAKSDDELVAVLAHEIGHVRGRHALRQLLQAAGVSAIAMALLGDVSSISGVLSAAPSLLHARNSREFETEADTFARAWLKEHGIAESNFDSILCRITGADQKKDAEEFDFFASHPATGQRARCVAEPQAEKPN